MFIYLRALAVVLLAACSVSPALAQRSAAPAVLSDEESANVDTAAQSGLTGLHVPGMAVAIVRNGSVVYRKGFGVTNLASKAAVQTQTQFEIGSITKQFTAAAVLQLVAQHKIKLNDPLSKYVPSYRAGRAVTVQQLLNQVSGIPDYTDVKHFEAIAPKTKPSFDRILGMVAAKPLEFTPGTKWKYSNTNYILLGKVIEVASHEPFTTYLFGHVIRPAGMVHTVTMDDEKRLTNVATGYWPKDKGGLSPAPAFGAAWAGSAGFLVSDLDDMIAWDAAFFGGKIISPGDVTLATTPGTLKNGKTTTYGFGWVVDNQGGHKRIWHNGGTFGFSASNMTYPDERLQIIVLANAPVPIEAIGARIFEVFYPSHDTAAAGEDPKITARAKSMLQQFQSGTIDRSELSEKMSKEITPALLASAKSQIAALGEAKAFTFKKKSSVGGSTQYIYRADFASISLNVLMSIDTAGKIDGFFLQPAS